MTADTSLARTRIETALSALERGEQVDMTAFAKDVRELTRNQGTDVIAYPHKELAGANELVRAVVNGSPIWPNDWGQDVAAVAFYIEKLRKAAKALPDDHKKFAIVMNRFEDGPSLAVYDGEHYVFCDGDCFVRDGDFLDGYPATFYTDYELQQLLAQHP